jgi:hypothetical protein
MHGWMPILVQILLDWRALGRENSGSDHVLGRLCDISWYMESLGVADEVRLSDACAIKNPATSACLPHSTSGEAGAAGSCHDGAHLALPLTNTRIATSRFCTFYCRGYFAVRERWA